MTLQPARDDSASQWIVEQMTTFAKDIGSLIPATFESYARVLHPAGKGEGGEWQRVRWRDIAEANGYVPDPKMTFNSIVPAGCFDEDGLHWRTGQPGLWDWPPSDGELPDDVADALSRALAVQTTTPARCYFAYWNGYGDPAVMFPPARSALDETEQKKVRDSHSTGEIYLGTPRQWRDTAPTFSIPGRDYYLFEGSIDDVSTEWNGLGGGYPTMWWPEDRAWLVHTEIDFDTTYVGGSRQCIEAVAADPNLEALEVQITSGLPRAS